MHDYSVFHQLLVFLLAPVVVVPLFRRLRSSPIVGYLMAGILIGPQALGLIVESELTSLLAELGVAFLLFAIGLELSLARLKVMRRLVFGLGGLQVVLTACLIGIAAGLLGADLPAAIVIGSALALSSTAFVLQLLVERGEQVTRFGRTTFAILLFQDLAVVPLAIGDGAFDVRRSPALSSRTHTAPTSTTRPPKKAVRARVGRSAMAASDPGGVASATGSLVGALPHRIRGHGGRGAFPRGRLRLRCKRPDLRRARSRAVEVVSRTAQRCLG